MRSVLCAVAMLFVVPAFADDKPVVRELDLKNVKTAIPKDGEGKVVTEIKTAEELAKSKAFVDDASREAIKKQVDFAKEKLVVVTWWGSSSSSVQVKLPKDGKSVEFDIVTANPALADLRFHIHVFAVPKDVTVGSEKSTDLVKLSLTGVKIDFDKGGNEPKPVEIKSADELAKAVIFADDASREAIKKQIDFSKQKLVVFVWSGSGSDKLDGAISISGKSVAFTYTRGVTDDLREHAHIFAVPKDCEVKMAKPC